ncbi:cold shock protein [Spongiibacter sp. IMCC21906]|jgi:CspA family cold shock protein|nr:cold shock protein [Spongiibacter sp. IMCC21906]
MGLAPTKNKGKALFHNKYNDSCGSISMQNGVVKWFNNAKGYGFILSENSEEEVFAHYSAISMEGYKTLKAGQSVSFDAEPGPKGLHATSITTDDPER